MPVENQLLTLMKRLKDIDKRLERLMASVEGPAAPPPVTHEDLKSGMIFLKPELLLVGILLKSSFSGCYEPSGMDSNPPLVATTGSAAADGVFFQRRD